MGFVARYLHWTALMTRRASDSSRLASDPYLGIDSSLGFEVVASFESIDALVAAA
jgi:hypothetical protein